MLGTTHTSPKSGHGPRMPRQERHYVKSVSRRYRHSRGGDYLKTWGSRPEAKREPVLEHAA